MTNSDEKTETGTDEANPDEDVVVSEDTSTEEGVEQPSGDADGAPMDSAGAEPAAESRPEPAPPPTVPKRRGGFLGLVAGGIIAAVIGFVAAQYIGHDIWPFGAPAPDVTAQKLADQAANTADLGNQVAALAVQVSDLAAVDVTPKFDALEARISAKIAPVSAAIDAMTGRVAALDARVTELEKRPIAGAGGDISGAVAAYEKELEAMRNELAAQRVHNQELSAKVTAAAAAASAEIAAAASRAKGLEARAAMMRIMAALDAGGSFRSSLDSLGIADVPAALAAVADAGAPTVAGLRDSFAAPAREALAASLKAEAGDGAGNRLTAFLRTQVGARSLTPREGNDPDAILSRAEAAVKAGQVAAALAEIATLPDVGQQAMASWVDDAQSRIDALAGANALAARLTQN